MGTIEDFSNIKGILFDVDGTLYHQAPLRLFMILLLIASNINNPKGLFRKARVIKAYRKAQEILRTQKIAQNNCADRQISFAVLLTREPTDYVSEVINEWFEKRPLPFLPFCRRKDLKQALNGLAQYGFRLGIFSDYPARHKLKALGIDKYFKTVVTSKDPGVTGFKPITNGFDIAAQKMGLPINQILYVGDRVDIDGDGATAAGMPVVIIKGFLANKKSKYLTIQSMNDLLKLQSNPDNDDFTLITKP